MKGSANCRKSGKQRPAAVLALLLALSLFISACGGGNNTTEKDAENTSESKTAAAETDPAETVSKEAAPAEDAVWTEMDQLKQLNPAEISQISYVTYGEDGKRSNDVTDPAEIENIYLRLCNVRLGDPTDWDALDDDLYIDVTAGDQKLSFKFVGDYAVLDNNQNYDVEQLDILKDYLLALFEEAEAASAAENAIAGNTVTEKTSTVFEGDYTFDVDEDKYLVIADEDVTMVYTGGGMQMPCFVVEEETDTVPVDDIGGYLVQTKNDTIDQLQNRLTGEPQIVTVTIGDRKLAGLEYSYSSVKGDRTIEACYYLEPVGDRVFSWYGLWNRGDETTPAVMVHALETFKLK